MRFLIFCCAVTLAAQSLTTEQQKIVSAVNADADDLPLKLLEQIVNINSGMGSRIQRAFAKSPMCCGRGLKRWDSRVDSFRWKKCIARAI